MPVLETVVVVLVGLALGAAVAVLPFVVPLPAVMLTPEFMRIWVVLGPVLALVGIWYGLRRKGRIRRRPRPGPMLRLEDQ